MMTRAFIVRMALMFLSLSLKCSAQYIIREGGKEGAIRRRTIFVPYAFSTESLGFGLGAAGTYTPESQPQSLYYGAFYVTDNESRLGLAGVNNINMPGVERLIFKPYAVITRQTQMRLYVGFNNPADPSERAGSNESSKDNYQEENARDVSADLEMRYILPWGHFRDQTVHRYHTRNGLLQENPSGGTSWNPFESGQSTLLFRPHYRRIFTDLEELETLFFEAGFQHDNRDYIPNPHRGYNCKFSIQHDFNWLEDTRRWTSLEGEIDAYVPLRDTSWSRQQTLALSCWSAFSPSYDPGGTGIDGKPPFFTGPTLGGLWRLRGYPSNRFHDKAAVHYTVEYRVMPEWQPLGNIDLLDPLLIRWWQAVLLFEVGRVAPDADIRELHTDMKYNAGIGLRGMFDQGIGRIDLVVSDEGFSVAVMLGQTF